MTLANKEPPDQQDSRRAGQGGRAQEGKSVLTAHGGITAILVDGVAIHADTNGGRKRASAWSRVKPRKSDSVMFAAVAFTEALACILLSALLTAVGTALLVWEQVRWRRVRDRKDVSSFEARHNYWRMLRRTAISAILVVGGPALAVGWLTIDEEVHQRAFIVFWTVVNAVALALILLALLDALVVLRFGLKESARLNEERVETLAELVRMRRRLKKGLPHKPTSDLAERN